MGKGVAFDCLNFLKAKYGFTYSVVLPDQDGLGDVQSGLFGMLASDVSETHPLPKCPLKTARRAESGHLGGVRPGPPEILELHRLLNQPGRGGLRGSDAETQRVGPGVRAAVSVHHAGLVADHRLAFGRRSFDALHHIFEGEVVQGRFGGLLVEILHVVCVRRPAQARDDP